MMTDRQTGRHRNKTYRDTHRERIKRQRHTQRERETNIPPILHRSIYRSINSSVRPSVYINSIHSSDPSNPPSIDLVYRSLNSSVRRPPSVRIYKFYPFVSPPSILPSIHESMHPSFCLSSNL